MNNVHEMIFCNWLFDATLDMDFYNTSCGHTFFFVDVPSATENQFKYCPYCGRRISDNYAEVMAAPGEEYDDE